MSDWRVTQGSNQFTVPGLPDLIKMAQKGDLDAGDMIQPPGASDWIYATEVPGLSEHFSSDDDDLDYNSGGMKKMLPMLLTGALLGIILIGGAGIAMLVQYLPDGDEVLVGNGGMSYSEMIVTNEGTGLRNEPDERSPIVTSVPKDSTLELLAKRENFYKARTSAGMEGWLPVPHVLPMYMLGGQKVQEKYDPLYNPDHYVEVVNASWTEIPAQDDVKEKITIFHFMFANSSSYDMTDLVILATIKNAKGGVIDTLEIPIGGVIPAGERTMVGTLRPPKDAEEGTPNQLLTEVSFNRMSINDPELQERWEAGLEVAMKVADFDNASVDILELRAIPDDEAKKKVRHGQ